MHQEVGCDYKYVSGEVTTIEEKTQDEIVMLVQILIFQNVLFTLATK